MTMTYTPLATITVGSGGATNITFSNISQDYKDLIIKCTTRSTDNAGAGSRGLNIGFNGTTSNVSGRWFYSVTSPGTTTVSNTIAAIGGTGATVSTFSNTEIYLYNYTSSNYKAISTESIMESNSSTAFELDFMATRWSSTAAITSVTIYPDTPSSFAQYSTFYLYGIR